MTTALVDRAMLAGAGPPPRWTEFPRSRPMPDLAYALLLIGSFALLVLMLRGLDSL
jgi:hypothetical protein